MTNLRQESVIVHYLCIECPIGCRLEVELDDAGAIVEVHGAVCRKGNVFAEHEHTDPRRMVTATVAVLGGILPRLPVRTTDKVPKDRVWDVVELLHLVTVESPVAMGDLIIADVAGTGVDIVASRDMPVGSED